MKITRKCNITCFKYQRLARFYKLLRKLSFLCFVSSFIFRCAIRVRPFINISLNGSFVRAVSSRISGFNGSRVLFSVTQLTHDRIILFTERYRHNIKIIFHHFKTSFFNLLYTHFIYSFLLIVISLIWIRLLKSRLLKSRLLKTHPYSFLPPHTDFSSYSQSR